MKVRMTLNGDSFEAEGEFTFEANFNAAVRQWINAISDKPNAVDALADSLNQGANELDATVQANPLPAQT